jgi:hypothetical protein
MLRVVETDVERKEESGGNLLDELAREGARRMLVKALETEVATYLAAAADEPSVDTSNPTICGRAKTGYF